MTRHSRSYRYLFSVLFALLLTSCFEDIQTTFPAGLEPFEQHLLPERATGSDCGETLTMERTRYQGINAVHASGCIATSLDQVFAALRNPCTAADRSPDSDFCYEPDSDLAYPYSHRSHLHVHGQFVPVYLQMDWRHAVVTGSEAQPLITATKWQKTDGFGGIPTLEGSIVARQNDDGFTDLQIQYHLDALGQGYETIEEYLNDIFTSYVADAHGRPLPDQGGPAHGPCAPVPEECPFEITPESTSEGSD